jgi:hypothetical protein
MHLPPEVAEECRLPTNMIDTSIFGLKDVSIVDNLSRLAETVLLYIL